MITLYRKGDSHVVRGVTCESGRFEVSQMQSAIDAGWVADPNTLAEDNEETEAEGEQPDIEQLRATAKQLGIEGWEKKRSKTLIAEIGERREENQD